MQFVRAAIHSLISVEIQQTHPISFHRTSVSHILRGL